MAEQPRTPPTARLPVTGGSPAEVARLVNGLLDGRSANVGRVTLKTGTNSTVVVAPIFRASTLLILVPLSATAAAVAWWQSSVDRNAVTIGHDVPGADADFGWVAVG